MSLSIRPDDKTVNPKLTEIKEWQKVHVISYTIHQ